MPSSLKEQSCHAQDGDAQQPSESDIAAFMKELSSHWKPQGDSLVGQFQFENYYETQAFVNAVAYIAHREDHHPEISFGYKACEITYTTHSIDGLSRNDFICAAKIDALID